MKEVRIMANADFTEQSCNNQQQHFKYSQLLWGDLIYGTKNQLQSIGIAVDMLFPGEPGGAKRTLNVLDPRGFRTRIEKAYRKQETIYSASIPFPGRERGRDVDQWEDFAAGVRKNSVYSLFDEYIGTADALVAAGLVRGDKFPGMPGMRKVRVTILPDGSVQMGATSNCSEARNSGAKLIEAATKNTYRVRVIIPKDEEQSRDDARKRSELAWETRMRALPRPAPLIAYHRSDRVSEMTPAPMYRVDGNVIHILSMAGMVAHV
jgi:hypothetical protein